MPKTVGRRPVHGGLTKREALRLWNKGRPVQVDRRPARSTVVSVPLPNPVFDELVAEARRQGKGPAAVAREMVEEAVARKRHRSRRAPARWAPPPVG